MNQSEHKRRLIENEAVFRNWNESIYGLGKGARIEGLDNKNAQFMCECSDENCTEKITLQLRSYGEIHKSRDHFIVMHGHEVQSVESVIFESPQYTVVQKKVVPPEDPGYLAPTKVENTYLLRRL